MADPLPHNVLAWVAFGDIGIGLHPTILII